MEVGNSAFVRYLKGAKLSAVIDTLYICTQKNQTLSALLCTALQNACLDEF